MTWFLCVVAVIAIVVVVDRADHRWYLEHNARRCEKCKQRLSHDEEGQCQQCWYETNGGTP